MAEQTLTQYQYDEAGNEIAQIDALGRTNTYAYDGMGRKIVHSLPALSVNDGYQTEGWAYDFNGNQIAHTNFDQDVAYNQYDTMNRLTNRFNGWYPSEYDSYAYTLTGQRSGMYSSDSSFQILEAYDSRDRLIQKTMNWGIPLLAESLTYGYDVNGNVTNIASSYANGVHLAYGYDPLNRLTNVLAGGQMAAGYSYDLAGNLTSMHYANDVTNQYQYDSLNRLTNLVWNYNNVSRASFAYTLMNGGTRTNLVETTNSVTWEAYQWSYDNLYRLTNENVSANGNVAYAYDPVGNRTNQSSTISAVPSDTYTYDTNDELVADGNGNYPSYNGDNEMSGWGQYSWNNVYGIPYDYLGRLILAQVNSPVQHGSSYWYDSEDNMVGRMIDNGNKIFEIVDDRNPSGYPQILEEITQNSGLTRVYNFGLALISQQQFDANTLLPSVLSYYGYDGHGNVRFLMSTNGAITDTYTYDAFGNLISQWYNGSGPTPNDYLYCGLQFDTVSGTYNNRARRMFSPLGRFTSMDQTDGNNEDPLSLHKYLYAEDEPVDGVDPSGNAVYFVERHFEGAEKKFAFLLGYGHGYLLFTSTSDPGTGDPFDTHQQILHTFSWHPYSWNFNEKAMPGVPGRVWENDTRDDWTPGAFHIALLVTTDSSQQQTLLNYINGWKDTEGVGYEYGFPIPDKNDPGNEIGNPHVPAPSSGGVFYSLYGQNCVWWSTVMLMDSGINVPDPVYWQIQQYNHGIGYAQYVIAGLRSPTTFGRLTPSTENQVSAVTGTPFALSATVDNIGN